MSKTKSTKMQDIQYLQMLLKVNSQFDQVMEFYKNSMNFPAEVWNKLDESRKEKSPELFAKVARVYDEHFTQEEIKALINFYESDIGKVWLEKQPQLTKEVMEIGRVWGEEIGHELTKLLGD